MAFRSMQQPVNKQPVITPLVQRFFISAGEASGDLHAATVVAELKQRFPKAVINGIAGSQMQQQGCIPIHHMHELNVMGISDVLRSLSRIRRIEQSILSHCITHRPNVAILVDFSSFHMRLGRKLKQLNIPVIHFIAPKLWAWGSWRVRKLKKSQDYLASILPFETDWFSQQGITHVQYVGNPSVISCLPTAGWSAQELKQRLDIHESAPLLALLPGSRPQEICIHVPILAEALKQLQQKIPELACVIPVAPGVKMDDLQPLLQLGAKAINRTDSGYAMRADAAVAVSGTATLELALWNTPTILIYKASALTAFLARRLVKLDCVGLANIILGHRMVMPELIQEDCQVEGIVNALLPLINKQQEASQQRREFENLRDILGQQNPAVGVVNIVETIMHSHQHQH